MNDETISKLLHINQQFYQTFAVQFAATRRRIQPGVRRVLDSMSLDVDVLDVGCGNGEFARQLAQRGYCGNYLGLDFSPGLLDSARQHLPGNFTFIQSDLSMPGWAEQIRLSRGFTLILAFAVFHHIPSRDLRSSLLSELHKLLAEDGRLIHSEWQFLSSPRLLARLQPWEMVGLSPSQVDEGDYLLDWRSGGNGLRYVHLFTESELHDLAQESSFSVVETFYSDGHNGKLGLYQIWEKRKV